MQNLKKAIIYIITINVIIILLFLLVILNTNLYKKTSLENTNPKVETPTETEDHKPNIILKGDDITLNQFAPYNEPGFTATDKLDGDLTSQVAIKSNLDNKTPGTYQITYTVENSNHNKTEVSRNVTVKPLFANLTYETTKTDNEQIKSKLNELDNYLNKYHVSVGYININNDFTYTYNFNQEYFGASLIKTLDAMYVYENKITDEQMINNVKKAITVSDNNAHQYLVKNIGFTKLKEYANQIGAPLTTCNSLHFCNTNVKSQLTFLTHLYLLINTLDNGEELASYFNNDYANYLNLDSNITFLHKYGLTDAYYHDVGIYNGDNPYIIVILTKERKNTGDNHIKVVNSISSKIYELNQLISEA